MIDPQTHQQLRARFNPDGSDMREFQLRILEILRYIDRICRENDIKYWASSGTCIGAVRHGGFIPWDDDADLEMYRDDLKKFRQAVIADNHPRFKFYDHSFDSEYVTQFPKVIDLKPFEIKNPHTTYITRYHKHTGAFVDIFIVEPSNSKKIHRLAGAIQSVALFRLNHIKAAWLRKGLKNINYFLLSKVLFPFLRLLQRPFAGDTVRHTTGVEFDGLRNQQDMKSIEYIDFEDMKLAVPADSNSYLTRIFGDYNQLPNLDTLESHCFEFGTSTDTGVEE